MPSYLTFLTSSILGGVVALLWVATASTGVGCTTAETVPAPDAAQPPCERGPFIFCQALPASDQGGCSTADGTSPYLSVLPRVRYPVGCVIDYVGPRDPQGDCRLEAVCKCVVGQGGTTPTPDAGTDLDAGDAGDAAAPAPSPAEPGQGPTWQCYP